MAYSENYHVMRDGTIKQKNPFTGTEVWCPPGRANRPMDNQKKQSADRLKNKKAENQEDFCDFCAKNLLNTPPEKARLYKENSVYVEKRHNMPNTIFDEFPLFRRVSNLFEIVTYDYWQQNYGYELSPEMKDWKYDYLSLKEGHAHCLKIINTKLKIQGINSETLSDEYKLDILSDSFFGGCHELVIPNKHYVADAEYTSDLSSSGTLTVEEHNKYFKFTLDSILDIHIKNRFVRYVSVFQNWLAPAGASFNHLHKQLVGLDEWGASIENEFRLLRSNRNIYNEYITNFAIYYDLIIAENTHAIAVAEYGHRFPTIGIYSKSEKNNIFEHSDDEVNSMSDMLHAIHYASGNQIACNEEWFYTPLDSIDAMPWHILIKWRIINQAGFEGGTKIYINPFPPHNIKEQLIPKLEKGRENAEITQNIKLGKECVSLTNPLKYYKTAY